MSKTVFPTLGLTGVLAAIVLSAVTAAGQTAPEAAPQPREHLRIEDGALSERLPGEDWKNAGQATLGDAVKALSDLYPHATIAIDPKLTSVPLADLKVRSADVQGDLEALCAASGNKFAMQSHPADVYTLEANGIFFNEAARNTQRDVQVFSLAGYLQELNKKDDAEVDKAITRLRDIIGETIGAVTEKAPSLKFQYYSDAKLLVVIGSPQDIEVAGKVIEALPGQENPWRAANNLYGNMSTYNVLTPNNGGQGGANPGALGTRGFAIPQGNAAFGKGAQNQPLNVPQTK